MDKQGFSVRYAKVIEEKNEKIVISSKTEFENGVKAGKMRYTTASKYMKLVNCGLDRFIEANTNVVWAKEGDNIVRLESNLEWVDELLAQESPEGKK